MKNRLVSIIMPCYKMGRFIGAALESVGRQTHTDWEVLAVDDCGPEDGTREQVEAFARQHPEHRVEWIRHAENAGVSAARNTAIEASRGEWLAFLDPDDLWMPNHLRRVVEVSQGDACPDLVTGPVMSFRGEDLSKSKLYFVADWKKDNFPASLAIHNFIQPSATLLRRSAFDRVGPFVTDPEFQHIEDYDMWIRLAKSGASVLFLDGASCYYRKHDGAATSDNGLMQDLHGRLYSRHLGFFMEMQGLLVSRIMGELGRSSAAISGPTFRLAAALDRLLRRLRDRIKN